MIRRPAPDRGLDVLRRLAAASRTEGERSADRRPAFLDGLLIGAMVGAAIAGSTAWSRWQARRRAVERGPRAGRGS